MSFCNGYDNKKQFIVSQLKWTGIYILVGGAIALILSFPASLFAALGVFGLLNIVRTRIMLKRSGPDVKGLFKSFSSVSGNSEQHNPVRYYCMNCGKEHREISCPICGSKMKRAGL
jgi:hypothetical protein